MTIAHRAALSLNDVALGLLAGADLNARFVQPLSQRCSSLSARCSLAIAPLSSAAAPLASADA